jgi:tetratricopeptide (TPR) repeat protein
MKRKVFIAIAIAIILASASVSTAQPKPPIPSSQPSKSVPALSEEQVKSLIQAETQKKDALRGQAEAEGKFNFTMVWVQVLLAGVSALLAFIPILFLLIGYILWACRKAILGQLNTEAMEEVGRRVEEHLKTTIDTEVKAQILNQLVQEFKAAVPASTQEKPSPEKLSQIEDLRRRIEDLQDLMPTMMMQSAEYYVKRGNAFYFEKRYEEAIASYDKALEFKRNDSEVWSNRGVVLGELKRYEEAIMSFSKAIEFEPDNSITWSNRGIALGYLKRYEEAISSYEKALKFRPDNSLAWSNRGIALSYLKRYEEALNSHNKAIEFNPDFPEAFYNRACCYALQEKIAETVHDLKRAIELDSIYREQAKTESDFNKVRHDEEFQKLLNGEL